MSHSGWSAVFPFSLAERKALRVAGQFYISMSFYHCARKGRGGDRVEATKRVFCETTAEPVERLPGLQCGEIKGAQMAKPISEFQSVFE
jgi:hypothetical protein